VRGDLPASLDHVGDVDEFDAALIRGAGGVPAEQTVPEQDGDDSLTAEQAELVPSGGGRGGRGGRRGGGDGGDGSDEDAFGGEAAVPARPSAQPTGNRVIAFLRASWAELQRVQWPNRRQVSQATAVVLGFVAVAGAYLGAADWVAQKIVNFILS
jgi:preprotein translocase subunit SecE